MRRLFFVIVLCLFAVPAYADFNIEIQNNTDLVAVYWLYHVDHPFRDEYPAPFNFAGGELQPGKTSELIKKRQPGIYIFKWTVYKDYKVDFEWIEQKNVGPEVEKVIMCIPEGIDLEYWEK